MRLWLIAIAILAASAVSLYTARRLASGQNTFLGHLAELRRRILLSFMTVIGCAFLVFSFGFQQKGGYWVPWPSVHHNMAAQFFDALAQHLVPPGVELVVVKPLDGFTAQLVLALGIGTMIAMPVLLHHAVAFLGPALKPNEQRALLYAMVPAVVLFLGGLAFCWIFVLPFVLETLYGYGNALGAQPLLQVSDLVSFAMSMMLVFGLAFQTPLVMVALAKSGVASASGYLRHWRGAVVGIFVLSALVTDPSVVSQLLVAGPLLLLYGLGVGLSAWLTR